MSCIETNLPYFKELQTKLNVAAPVLKQILHKLQRDRGNLDISPEEIDLWLQGDSVEFGENSLKLYEQSYKEPIIVNEEEYANALAQAKAAFPAEAVRSYQGVDGNYVIRVAEPTNSILKNAKRDSEGRLLADNGKVSNLTEQQYVRVRTPQFKRWFGDWQKSPETASKIVDENGEPLVVYRGDFNNKTVFFPKSAPYNVFGIYIAGNIKMAENYAKKSNTKVYEIFVNSRNPFTENNLKEEGIQNMRTASELWHKNGKLSQYDGWIYGTFPNGNGELVVDNPNQIKSATDNTDFSQASDNIYEEESLAYSSDSKSKQSFLRSLKRYSNQVTGFTRNLVSWRNNNTGDEVFVMQIPKNSQLEQREEYRRAQAQLNQMITSNKGDSRDFYLSKKLSYIYENGIVVGQGFTIIPKERKITYLEQSRTNELKRQQDQIQKWKWDAALHERQLVDPQLREQWEREYRGEEEGNKPKFDFVKLRSKEHWTMLRGEEILAELPIEVREGVAKSITEYSESKNRGEEHREAASIYFPEGNTRRSASELLDDIIKNSPDKEIVRLAKIARKNLKNDAVVSFKPGNNRNPRGRFHTDGTISIYGKATKGESVEDATRGLERTMVHEIIHAITVDTIETNRELRKEIAGIMGQLQDYLNQNGIDNWVYALKNEKEFIAEFMSQPFFREALKHMPSKINNKPSNFFQRVLNAIKSAIGIKGKTLFNEANSAFMHILNTEAKDEINERIEDLAEEAQENQSQEPTQKQDKMLEQIYTINRQFSRILENKVLTSTDLAEVSDVIADMISSKIDEMEAKRDQVKEILVQRNPNDDTDVNKLSRFELIEKLGIQHFIDLVKQDFVRNKRIAAAENRVKITEVVKNWDYFINRIKSTISKVEGIHLEVDAIGERTVVVDESLTDQYEEDGSNVQDQVEDGQLSWQVENNTIDPITSITQLVKLQLRGLFQLKDNGRRDKEGNPLYDHIRTKWGTDAKVGHDRAAKCLYRWLSGKQTLKEMVEVLQKKSKRNPWVTQLLPKLTDTTGKYTTEQCQFFSTFYKPFMKFTNVGTKNGKLTSRQLNEHPFLTIAMKTIEASYKLGQHPLVANGLAVGAKALNSHYTKLQELVRDFENNKEQIFEELRAVTKGLGFEINVAELQLDKSDISDLMYQLGVINDTISKNVNNAEYDPFTYSKDKGGIRSNFMRFFEKVTDFYEDEAVTSFYEGGKMRQSYLLPSFLTMFTNKFHLEEAAFNRFLADEFNTEFMRNTLLDDLSDEELRDAVKKGWNIVWLQHMMSDTKKRLNFKCKTSLTFNGKTYMRGMSEEEYALAMITEFFGENSKETDPLFLANFRVPIESNKPSAEYITFYARGGAFFKEDLVGDFLKVFNQEISRIKTVLLREKSRKQSLARLKERYEKGDITAQQYKALVYSINQEAITNFDSRGKKFVYLDFLNREVEENTELGNLIKEATEGKKVDTAELSKKAAEAIRTAIQERVDRMIETFKQNGVFELCKTIEKIGNSNEAVQKKLELMFWNDAFASTQIMQLLITDPAFLKNTDDVQKRFAQVHASGTRANLAAVDFEGHEVSDGVHRSITLKDVEGFTSNIIDNLTIVLDRKIEAARKANNRSEIIAWEAFKDKLVGDNGLYRKGINLTDAQAYSCPTSYRKKALMFGLWSKEAEATYNRIKEGNYTYSDVVSVFQPFKPFVYGNSVESTGVNAEGAMTKMRVPVQNKNAECLLVMADAILAGEETGKPNLLRALFEVMEESHYDTVRGEDGSITRTYKKNGIDTVNFESAVKSGAQGRIDTQAYAEGREITITDKEGKEQQRVITPEAAFKSQLKSLIYKTEIVNGKEVTTYNRTSVKHLSFENYCMQQSVPEHFLDHSQLEGSQQRALIPSDLATVDEAGNTIYYEVGEGKTKMTAAELREKYDRLHAENIQKGIEEIENLFMLKESTPQQRKEALSKLLVEQFLRDGRYSGDMLYMVTLNEETGDFPVSLEDPSIKTQVEQAINSIIKSRVNKLKMKGGPLVQMSNFGMSKELKIRFLDKDGNLLKDRSAFDSDEAYKEYITKNQKGISHFEVIAPAYTEAIFKEFMDKEGNISVEALEMLNPDLLKMIGYRIPTEAKYSIAPLKIVGFAPREMGDVIILPAEITLITGSDFDVDKEYCIRKALGIKPKYPKMSAERRGSKFAEVIMPAEANHSRRETVKMFADEFVNNPYDRKYWTSPTGGKLSDAEYTSFLKSYLDTFYVLDPATGIDANNNEIFDMSYAVLTSESNVARALKPGGFEEHKHIAYAVAAYRVPEVREKYPNFDTLLKMDTKEIGKLIERDDKNLMFLDTQLEYYGHNNSASSLLGISAVNSVAHAILVDDNIGLDLSDVEVPTIAGFQFNRYMRLDPSTAEDGASVAETLGSCVAASADAAKDPVLNFMNLNPQTFNVYTTLVRLGVPNSIATLFMSSKVLADAVTASNAKTLAGEWSTPESILREQISEESLKKIGYSTTSPVFREEITRDELIRGLHEDDVNINLKMANALVSLFGVSRRVRLADQVTRFNSISSAVGPTTVDNYIFQSKLQELDNESYLVDMNTGNSIGKRELLDKHKMLLEFSGAYDLANSILIDGMPQTKAFIESIEEIYANPSNVDGLDIEFGLPAIVKNDRSLVNKLRDFFTSWSAVKNGLVNYKELEFLSKEFPKTLASKKAEHSDNYLMQNLYLNIDNRSGFPIIAMNISMIEKSSRDMLTNSWADLYAKDKEFALNLFKYSFFRGGLGFSPKTFMNVLPIQMKIDVLGYLKVFKSPETLTPQEANLLYKQFISNNYIDNKLVPIKKGKPTESGDIIISKQDKNAHSFKNLRFFKTKDKNGNYTLYECVGGYEEGPVYRIYKEIPKLGAEGNFIELSTENIDHSLFDMQFEQGDNGNMILTPDVNDIPADRQKTIVEARKMLDTVLSQSQQQKTKEEVSQLEGQEKNTFIQKASARLSTILQDKGFTPVKQEVLDEMLNQLNLC